MSARATGLLVLVALAVACGDRSGSGPALVPGSVDVVPRPAEVSIDPTGTSFRFAADTPVYVVRGEAESGAAADLLVALLRGPFPERADASEIARGRHPNGSVLLALAASADDLGRDGYELEVTPERVLVRAAAAAGLVHGVQTLRQLLPPEVERRAPSPEIAFTAPSVRIRDVPRFGWRGLMLDSSRYFLSKPLVLRQLELAALYKVSVLHLHLTDDQGWRLESARYPELHELGSRWDPILAPSEVSGYYTKADIREILARAAALGVEVVPEIDMPGHIVAALHSLPDLACRTAADQPRTRDEFPIVPVLDRPFPPNILCVCDESAYDVVENLLDEVIELFPSEFVHVGGDEVVHLDEWQQGYLCQDLFARGVVAGADRLQAYFGKRIEDFLRSRGRRLLAWDEQLVAEDPSKPSEALSDQAAFMFWRDYVQPEPPRLYDRDMIAAPFTKLYLDYATPIDVVYGYEPVRDGLTPEQTSHILGVEGAMWTGYPDARSDEGTEKHIFPRFLAIAEIGWTPRELRDYADFARRLEVQKRRLDILGVAQGP